jgi:hypothetical protein
MKLEDVTLSEEAEAFVGDWKAKLDVVADSACARKHAWLLIPRKGGILRITRWIVAQSGNASQQEIFVPCDHWSRKA